MDATVKTNDATLRGTDASTAPAPNATADQQLNALMALFTGGLSPSALNQAWWDWAPWAVPS